MPFPNKKKPSQKPKLSPEQQYWQTVGEQSKSLITKCLREALPLPLDGLPWDKDKEFQKLISQELPEVYQEAEELPDSQIMAHELTYHYLTTLCSNLQDQLTTNYEE